jgi:hypothetical protein
LPAQPERLLAANHERDHEKDSPHNQNLHIDLLQIHGGGTHKQAQVPVSKTNNTMPTSTRNNA